MALAQILLFIRLLQSVGSSDLDVRWLQETLTECVQRRCLLEVYENKKDEKKRKRNKEKTLQNIDFVVFSSLVAPFGFTFQRRER